jgi:hypothetical protein
MPMFRILRDGKNVSPLDFSATKAIHAWWQGRATAHDSTVVSTLLADLHLKSQWLACDCQSGMNRPFLAPARRDDLHYLKRLPQRPPHAESCVFWSESVETATSAGGEGGVAQMGGAPSFLVASDDDAKVSDRTKNADSKVDAKVRNAGLPAMAKRLFWLAEKAGFQSVPFKPNAIEELLAVANNLSVSSKNPNFKLGQMLYCTPKVWTDGWADTAFNRCLAAGIPESCWWIQCAVGIDMKTRSIRYLNKDGYPFDVPVAGELKVFGGDCSTARFPMLVIGVLRKRKDGSVEMQKAYAQPVNDEHHWMLVDSNLERQTIADLRAVCRWLHDEKGVSVKIDKPLFDWNNTGERPDFVLTLERNGNIRHLVVETMGYDDPAYESRKAELSQNVGCEVYFDRRHLGEGQGKELKSSVARWALQG